MKRLNFRLISNKETQINKESNYFIKDNTLFFKDNEDCYQYNINNKIFIKKDKEKELTIDISNNNIIITLLENNYQFDMPIEVIKCENEDNKIVIEYTFMSDEQITNCIIIDY